MSQNKDESELEAERLMQEAVQNMEERESSSPKESTSSETVKNVPMIEKENYLRLAADFENFKRRAFQDRQEAERIGKAKILLGAISILDNLDRALEQSKEVEGPLKEGLKMILVSAEQWLGSEGLSRLKTSGELFDPNLHEALGRIPSEEIQEDHIIQELSRGYLWNGKLLRPATVMVSQGSGETKA